MSPFTIDTRLLRATSGHPLTAWRTGNFDPLLPFKGSAMKGEKREKAVFRLKASTNSRRRRYAGRAPCVARGRSSSQAESDRDEVKSQGDAVARGCEAL
jgi:hypothetical protein